MRLLLDQNLSLTAAAALRSRGIDAVHTREVGLATASDEFILEWCRQEQRVAITRDADFHSILAGTAAVSPSVVRIRIEPLSEPQLVNLIEWIAKEKRDDLQSGVAITVKNTSIRTHRLPLISTGADS